MQATQVRSEGTRYHFTEQQVFEEFVKMGMQQEMAVQFANRYCHSELTHLELEYLEKNINIRLNSLEGQLEGVQNRLAELKDDIKKLDAKIDSLEKNNKWIFGLTFTIWITTMGGFIALFLK
ncbi:Bdr family repetitive protein [Borrelia sp. RT1S]|uniref:Bdr family repetitive protein n=1 Tax=Borrelia sp. RT1S TaxID=2898580 RepID=UPI001E2F4802|nr:Bdr family repetitive protein [Borrelia sp. RT1S]UGQ17918.1 Bdr family repetitive protein [Borrelia sp. RT1S]